MCMVYDLINNRLIDMIDRYVFYTSIVCTNLYIGHKNMKVSVLLLSTR